MEEKEENSVNLEGLPYKGRNRIFHRCCQRRRFARGESLLSSAEREINRAVIARLPNEIRQDAAHERNYKLPIGPDVLIVFERLLIPQIQADTGRHPRPSPGTGRLIAIPDMPAKDIKPRVCLLYLK